MLVCHSALVQSLCVCLVWYLRTIIFSILDNATKIQSSNYDVYGTHLGRDDCRNRLVKLGSKYHQFFLPCETTINLYACDATQARSFDLKKSYQNLLGDDVHFLCSKMVIIAQANLSFWKRKLLSLDYYKSERSFLLIFSIVIC